MENAFPIISRFLHKNCLILSNYVIFFYCEEFKNQRYTQFLLKVNKNPGFRVIKYILLFSHEDLMINQRKLMFKKNIACELNFYPNAQSLINTFFFHLYMFYGGAPSQNWFANLISIQ